MGVGVLVIVGVEDGNAVPIFVGVAVIFPTTPPPKIEIMGDFTFENKYKWYTSDTNDNDVVITSTDSTYPSNWAMRGTKLMDGHGILEIKKVGDETEFGKVADLTQELKRRKALCSRR